MQIAISVILAGTLALHANNIHARESSPPNVLFIAVDDMRDWTANLGGYRGTVHTPHLQRLASKGVEFTNAHAASTVCCPSRTAIMTGLLPSTSGIYGNGQWWRPHMPDCVTIPMQFRASGYAVAGSGKIFHHTAGNNPPDQWDEYHRLVFNDDPWYRGHKLNYPWSKPGPAPEGHPLSGVEGLPHENDWGVLPGKTEVEYDDVKSVDFARGYLKRSHDKPFFLACGIFRPHLPWYVPKEYFDLYPLDKIRLPRVREDDLDDVPKQGRQLSKTRRVDFEKIKNADKWKQAVQAYLASISFADARVGRLLETLDRSPYANNTVIVFWSDHGWHLGEKNHWHKMTLWEEATRVPFIIAAPDVARPGERCDCPVGLIDIFPTLIDLCGLKDKPELDGLSLTPLLRRPDAAWSRPALSQYGRGQCAVRSKRWRYIRYSDGTEELYDHEADAHEWTNLAGNDKHRSVLAEHARWLPSEWAEQAPTKSDYQFDPQTYSWVHNKTRKTTRGKE